MGVKGLDGGVAQRETFKTSFGLVAATVGSAVGLGNIWRFPYIVGEYGGAAFLLVEYCPYRFSRYACRIFVG